MNSARQNELFRLELDLMYIFLICSSRFTMEKTLDSSNFGQGIASFRKNDDGITPHKDEAFQ